jgi:hypothetical protein
VLVKINKCLNVHDKSKQPHGKHSFKHSFLGKPNVLFLGPLHQKVALFVIRDVDIGNRQLLKGWLVTVFASTSHVG